MAYFPDVCKDCKPPKRKLNCHSTCKDYLDAKAEHAANTIKERKAKMAAQDADSATYILKRNG